MGEGQFIALFEKLGAADEVGAHLRGGKNEKKGKNCKNAVDVKKTRAEAEALAAARDFLSKYLERLNQQELSEESIAGDAENPDGDTETAGDEEK